FDLHGNFLGGLQAVENGGSGQDTDVAISLAEIVVLQVNLGIEKITEQSVAMHGVADLGFQLYFLVIQVHGREAGTGPAFQRSLATQNNALKFLGPAAGGNAQCAME